MSASDKVISGNEVGWWQPVLFGAMAGGLGWGIRGQYGHETGAMIAGVLVCLTLTFLLCRGDSSLRVVRAVALGTIAMGFGGSMTYGQTVGLTHDAPLVGNWAAFRWGMLGLAIKGGLWIGFAGFFFGLGLGGRRYRPLEVLLLLLGMLCAVFIGWWLFNTPHDPENRRLPLLYFSDHWRFEPELLTVAGHSYRPEIWGGLLGALATGVAYASFVKKDRLARNMAFWGVLGGAIGFPVGQCFQAVHAWSPEFYPSLFAAPFTNYLNWWNTMETSFGFIMGGILGLGLWLNRRAIDLTSEADDATLGRGIAATLLAIHVAMLASEQFMDIGWINLFYDFGIMMGLIPLVACVRGRYWPYLQILPITLLPIAGKTVRMLSYQSGDPTSPVLGWALYFVAPMLGATAFAVWAARKEIAEPGSHSFISSALLFTTWVYFGLNWAFFGFPWPWLAWGGRSANGLIFACFAIGLTAMVLFNGRNRRLRSSIAAPTQE